MDRIIVGYVVHNSGREVEQGPNPLQHVPSTHILAWRIADSLDLAGFSRRGIMFRILICLFCGFFLVAPRNRLLGCNLFLANFRVRRNVA